MEVAMLPSLRIGTPSPKIVDTGQARTFKLKT
jgi:hypothetical protein